VRSELLDEVASRVNAYHVRPQVDYDYDTARSRLIFEALTQGVQYVCNNAVRGDIAEFGTASGFSAYTLARAMAFFGRKYEAPMRKEGAGGKTLRLFDSFEGLPKADSEIDLESPNVRSGRWRETTFKGLTREELTALCASTYDGERIATYPGWFRDTVQTLGQGTLFGMLHLDCDLYSSTIEVLDPLFAKGMVADGCALFFDDWNCNRSSPRYGQRRAWREIVEKYKVEYSDGGDYAVLSHKFIIHTGR
jgi:hypothetical protein